MNCPKCHSYVSGNICKNCDEVLIEKKAKSKKIANRSEKMKDKDLVYSALRLRFLKDNPQCQVYPHLKANDVHHKKSRGKYYLDVSTWMSVSRIAHEKIHREHSWAVSMGYIESKHL